MERIYLIRLKTPEQVNGLHSLFRFLRRLRIIGVVHTKVIREPLSESGRGPSFYYLEIKEIDMKTFETTEERLSRIFEDAYISS